MLHICLALIISLTVTGQPSKAPVSSQNHKQTPDWLDTGNETTSTTVRDYTPAIDMPSVNLPTEETVWEHGDSRVRVAWDGLDGTLVKVQLLQNGSPIADVINWSDNNNSALIEGTIQSSWGSGSGFQIRVEDNFGNSLTSETFRIMAPINVSQPRITTVWSHAERDVIIAWSGSPGNAVDIVLFDGEYQVATLGSGIPNTGSFSYPGEVSSGWGTGNNYSVRITDDIGNEYNSRHFSINAINVSSPTAGTIWSDQNPTLNITWDGGARVVRIALYRGSTKIKELTEWIDNTGSCEIRDFLSHNLDAGSNYKIEVRDDQGDQGFSQALSVSYSQNTPQGAIQSSWNCIENTLPPNESMYFSTNLPSGTYRISIEANEQLEVSFQRSSGSLIKSVLSSQDHIYFSSTTEFIMVSNSSSSENAFEINIVPLHSTQIVKHRFYADWAPAFAHGVGTEKGIGIAYYYAISNLFYVGFDYSMSNFVNDDDSDYDFVTTRTTPWILVSRETSESSVFAVTLVGGLGYSLNSLNTESENPYYSQQEDFESLNENGMSLTAGIWYDNRNWDSSGGPSLRFMISNCPSSGATTISFTTLFLGYFFNDRVYTN